MPARRNRGVARSNLRQRQCVVHMERLEDRRMLAFSADLVKDILTSPVGGSSTPANLTEMNGLAYFTASGGGGRELWKSNGTPSGTVRVKEIDGRNSSDPRDLLNVGGKLFFSAHENAAGRELWVSNGTEAGTVRVKDITAGEGGSYPDDLTNVNGILFFSAGVHPSSKRELWRSDGTAAGTFRVRDIFPGTEGSGPSYLTNVNGTLFFTAYNGHSSQGGQGAELWKSDGTTAGTTLVKDISTPGSSYPKDLFNFNGTLVFTAAASGTQGRELWKSNGSAPGTLPLTNFSHSDPKFRSLTEMNGKLYFAAEESLTSGKELWSTDGTTEGTICISDPAGNPHNFSPNYLANCAGTLFFNANGGTGSELWRSDGTTAGTVEVKDINAGASSNPRYAFSAGGVVFFTANDGPHGTELWQTDGTAGGTKLVLDINTDSGESSSPRFFVNASGNILFAADDGTNGRELWRITGLPPELKSLPGSISYTENQASVAIAPSATTAGPSVASYNGGKLTVSIATGGNVADRLHLFHTGNGRGQIGLDGNKVLYDGNQIGTVAGGTGTTPLVVTFNSAARLFNIQRVVQALRFRTETDNPTVAIRAITLRLTDGAGINSATRTVKAKVIAVNDRPKLTLSGTVTYTEDGSSVQLAPTAFVADPDSTNFDGGRLGVVISANGQPEDHVSIRSAAPAPGVINVSGDTVLLNTTAFGTIISNAIGQPLLVTFNSNATLAAVQALARAITFRTVGDAPSTAQRTLQFVVRDGDGGTSDPALATKLVNVVAENDAPTLELDGSIAYTLDAGPLLLAATATVTDPDSANFVNGRLQVTITDGESATNRLSIGGGVTIEATNEVRLGDIIIGKRTSNGFGLNNLIIVFNANATAARVQQLVRAINFKTVSGAAGNRTVEFFVTDGVGGLSDVRTKTVIVS